MSGGDYRWHQKINQAANGTIQYGATGVSGTATVSGFSGVTNMGLHVQIVDLNVTTGSSGVTWSLIESSGSTVVAGPFAMDTVGTHYHFDFGDRGIKMPTSAGLQISGSASGACGVLTIEAYRAYEGGASVGFFPASGASGTTP